MQKNSKIFIQLLSTMTEKFNVKWNDFENNASKSFKSLRNETYLHDVTLISDDYKQISAHKLVLSACSEYFRSMFHQTQQQAYTLLCLDGVNHSALQNVLDYVYKGEVMMIQEDLDNFLNIAQRLKLEGLELGTHENMENDMIMDGDKEEEQPDQLSPSMSLNKGQSVSVKIEDDAEKQREKTLSMSINGQAIDNEQLQETLLENCTRNPDRSVSCKVCDKTFGCLAKAKRHIEIHIDGLRYDCFHCDKKFKSKNNLDTHIYSVSKTSNETI